MLGRLADLLHGPVVMVRRAWPSILALWLLLTAAALVFKWYHPEYTWIDASYASVATITTLGDYGTDMGRMQPGQKVLLMVIILASVAVAATALQEIVTVLLQRELWDEARTQRRVKRMDRHAVVVGSGPLAREVVKKLRSLGVPHAVVAPEAAATLEGFEGAPIIRGDLRRHSTLREAGIDRAAQVEIGLDDDALALVVTMNARELAPAARIVVNVDDEELTGHFKTAGADVVIGSSRVLGRIMAVAGVTANVSGIIFSDVAGLQKEIGVFRVAERSRAAGRSIEEAGIDDHAWVLGVVRTGEFQWETNRATVLNPGDEVVVLGEARAFEAIRKIVV